MIRVLIDRRIHPDRHVDYHQLQRRLRGEALRDHAYVSGETWRDADDPDRFVTLSTWRSRAAWDAWARSPGRAALLARLQPLLRGETITILEAPPAAEG